MNKISKGQKMIRTKMYVTQLFYSTYTIDSNASQMMVCKQWVKSWDMHRWAGEASI